MDGESPRFCVPPKDPMLQNLSVRSRLFATFGVVGLLLVILTGVAIWGSAK